jgi:hypothetical protein
LRRKEIGAADLVHYIAAQYPAVTIGCLIEPPYFQSLSDRLRWDAVIRRQKIGNVIVGTIGYQSARAGQRPVIVD